MKYGDTWRVTAYELVTTDHEDEGPYFVQIESVSFSTEKDANDWAGDMGYLDHYDYSVTVEDPNGTVTTL